jgi:hypothetical protein
MANKTTKMIRFGYSAIAPDYDDDYCVGVIEAASEYDAIEEIHGVIRGRGAMGLCVSAPEEWAIRVVKE